MTGKGKQGGIVLQARDYQFLAVLGQLRLVDREMAQILLKIPSLRNTNKRLLELTRAGLLVRFFLGTTGSGRKGVYTLSAKGAELVNATFRGLKRKADETLVGDLFVRHQLQVNSIFLTIRFQLIPLLGVRATRAITFYEPPIPSSKLIPDGYFELQSPAGIRALFLEADRGTEALRIWERKIQEYFQLAFSGDFERTFRLHQFRVLVVTTSLRRLRNIREVIAKTTNKIFWLSTFDQIRGQGFWSPVWTRPTGDQQHSLF